MKGNRRRGAVMAKNWKPGQPARQYWIKRGGTGGSNNSGPSGYQMRPARKMHRALAEMAASHGVVNGVKKSKTRREAVPDQQKKAA